MSDFAGICGYRAPFGWSVLCLTSAHHGMRLARQSQARREKMPIEHIGLGVPDVDAAKAYFDELMPMVGFQPCFGNGYCPEDFQGTQIFLDSARENQDYSRHEVGLQHLAFLVSTRDDVHRQMGSGSRRRDRSCAEGLPSIRPPLLRHLLSRPARLHDRGCHSRTRNTGPTNPSALSGLANPSVTSLSTCRAIIHCRLRIGRCDSGHQADPIWTSQGCHQCQRMR